jgi:hypothetical protein
LAWQGHRSATPRAHPELSYAQFAITIEIDTEVSDAATRAAGLKKLGDSSHDLLLYFAAVRTRKGPVSSTADGPWPVWS